ncbi:MAG: enoyl-CoA hydratase/isomerase family protein [Oligoflexia bacterium]|nr:enoyl-CoA hydratase/isomerase family protein [Oligoflexia bacterium]
MKHVHMESSDGIYNITLNRPEVHNALNEQMISELTSCFKTVAKDKFAMSVYLRGAGPSFCAGGDLNWMKASMKLTLAKNIKDAQKLSDMYETIFRCPVPVVAVVHGSVMGGGVGLTAVCDIVAAESETRFCLSEVKLGLVPSIISPYVLRKVPESHARGLMLTAEIFKAPRAQSLNLVHFYGTAADCEAFAKEKLTFISQNGPEALRVTKDLIQKIMTSTWPVSRKTTVQTIAQRRVSKEGQEGMKAFFEKRRPQWRKG